MPAGQGVTGDRLARDKSFAYTLKITGLARASPFSVPLLTERTFRSRRFLSRFTLYKRKQQRQRQQKRRRYTITESLLVIDSAAVAREITRSRNSLQQYAAPGGRRDRTRRFNEPPTPLRNAQRSIPDRHQAPPRPPLHL